MGAGVPQSRRRRRRRCCEAAESALGAAVRRRGRRVRRSHAHAGRPATRAEGRGRGGAEVRGGAWGGRHLLLEHRLGRGAALRGGGAPIAAQRTTRRARRLHTSAGVGGGRGATAAPAATVGRTLRRHRRRRPGLVVGGRRLRATERRGGCLGGGLDGEGAGAEHRIRRGDGRVVEQFVIDQKVVAFAGPAAAAHCAGVRPAGPGGGGEGVAAVCDLLVVSPLEEERRCRGGPLAGAAASAEAAASAAEARCGLRGQWTRDRCGGGGGGVGRRRPAAAERGCRRCRPQPCTAAARVLPERGREVRWAVPRRCARGVVVVVGDSGGGVGVLAPSRVLAKAGLRRVSPGRAAPLAARAVLVVLLAAERMPLRVVVVVEGCGGAAQLGHGAVRRRGRRPRRRGAALPRRPPARAASRSVLAAAVESRRRRRSSAVLRSERLVCAHPIEPRLIAQPVGEPRGERRRRTLRLP